MSTVGDGTSTPPILPSSSVGGGGASIVSPVALPKGRRGATAGGGGAKAGGGGAKAGDRGDGFLKIQILDDFTNTKRKVKAIGDVNIDGIFRGIFSKASSSKKRGSKKNDEDDEEEDEE